MPEKGLDCIAETGDPARPLLAVRPDGLPSLLSRLPAAQAAFLRDQGFAAAAGVLVLLPGPEGVEAAVFGLGNESGPHVFGGLPFALPAGTAWRPELPEGVAPADAALGFCLGAYRFTALKPAERAPARLVLPDPLTPDVAEALSAARAAWMGRDLINTPANLLGPADLAEAARALAERFGASFALATGEALERDYPAVAAVGRGSARPPCVATLHWRGSAAAPDAKLVSLCGKGVCFDTGGYDLKSAASMLRMKKDMGGAAIALGLARMIMEADLPVRLALRIGCVENSVSGTAMRPSDVLRTRAGLTVEVGNTDAEGRLVLCDLLADAAGERPALLADFATLTGAARVALGPDLPALFASDDAWAEAVLAAGRAVHDPLWRLPLWDGYAPWLASTAADINNVAGKSFAGAVVAALFLKRFIPTDLPWLHVDVYAWNDQTRPARPEGGEVQAMRAMYSAVKEVFNLSKTPRNMRVT